MNEYDVTVRALIEAHMTVEAESEDEAIRKVHESNDLFDYVVDYYPQDDGSKAELIREDEEE